MSSIPQKERSIGELLGELAAETSTLVRAEVKLATTEMTHKATHAAKQAAVVGVGSLLAAVSVLVLLAALILGLGTLIPLWLSALIVGAVVGLVAFVVVQTGIAGLKRIDPTPEQTIQSLKENKLWVQEQLR